VAAAPSRIAVQPKQADPIYRTPEYQAWRAKVINRAGGRCQWRDGATVCGIKDPRMFADHIVELQDGGAPYDTANGQCLCGSHHTIKTNLERARRTAA
jgi:uncharacterized protein YfaQ (DUF2300 family)